MAVRSRALAFGAVAALALVVVALFLLQGGGPSGLPETAQASADSASGTSEAPPRSAAPGPTGEALAAGRTAPTPDLGGRRAGAVRGRVVIKGDGKPVLGALVKLRTDEHEIDYPETVSLLGGTEGMARLRSEGLFEDRLREVGDWKAARLARSGAEGAFSIAVPLEFPQFRFEVEADFGVLPESPQRWFALGSPDLETGVTLRLDPAGKVEGTLLSPRGGPVAGARACAKLRDRWGGERAADGDAGGRFSIGGLRPGKYLLAGLGPGCGAAIRRDVEVRAGEIARVTLDLPAEGFAAGRVVDEEGRGVALAKVSARPHEGEIGNFGSLRYGFALSDAEGSFRVGSLLGGKHSVTASRVGRVPAKSETVEVPAGFGVESLKLVLAGGKTLAGRVVDGAGNPVPNAEVNARTDRTALRSRGLGRARSASSQMAVSTEDGSFHLGGLDEGPFLVGASLKGRGRAERREVPAGAEGVELVLEAAGSIAGKVRDAESGEAVLRFDVQPTRLDPSRGPNWSEGQGQQSFATRDGAFELKDRKPGVYDLTVRAKGFVPERVRRIELKTGEAKGKVEVGLRRGSAIRGTVVDKASTAPVEEAFVWVQQVEASVDGGPEVEVYPSDPTGPDGSYEVAGLMPGTWKVHARREGFVDASGDPIRVAERDTIEGIAIALSRGGGIDGFAVGEDGIPYAGGNLSVSRAGREGSWEGLHGVGYVGDRNASGAIDAAGYFRVEGLSPGKYAVEAHPPSKPGESWEERQKRALRARAVVEEGNVARVEWARPKGGCIVRGRVLRGNAGAEGVGVSIALKRPEGDAAAGAEAGFSRQARTGSGGGFEIPHVPAGEAEVTAHSDVGGSASAKVTVPDARELLVELRFPGGEISGRVVSGVDGAPLERVFVSARLPVEPGKEREARTFHVQTGEDGRYRIRDIPAGSYALRSGPGSMTWRGDDKTLGLATEERTAIEVREDAPTIVDFTLPVGGKALVTVRDGEGKPRPGANVEIRGADGKPRDEVGWAGPENWSAPTGEDGTARVIGLPAGNYVAVARFGGCAASASEEGGIRLGQETAFRVDLREGTRVRVRVLGPDDKRPKGAWCSFTDVRGLVSHPDWGEQRDPKPEEKGFLLFRLLPGEYGFQAQAEGFRQQRTSVLVGSASPQVVEVRLVPQPREPEPGPR